MAGKACQVGDGAGADGQKGAVFVVGCNEDLQDVMRIGYHFRTIKEDKFTVELLRVHGLPDAFPQRGVGILIRHHEQAAMILLLAIVD